MRRIFGIWGLSVLSLFAIGASTQAASDLSLSLISDAAGMFNERGYLKSNSFSLDGEELINNYNGNLIYTQRLYYRNIYQNGVHLDVKLAYNGSVGHTIASGHNLIIPEHKKSAINIPEWILSVNDIAVQTFNFENEWMSWATRTVPDTASVDSMVSCLINGYHDCYNRTYGDTIFSTISILKGDGSVQQFLNIEFTDSLYQGGPVVLGEYRTMTKSDRSKGLVVYNDSTFQFVYFQENGNRIYFDFYRPKWKSTILDHIDYNDSLWILLPVKFEDQFRHSIRIKYDTTNMYGRPLVKKISHLDIRWYFMGGYGQGVGMELWKGLIYDANNRLYRIHYSDPDTGPASLHMERNRALVTRIWDKLNREIRFEYQPYIRVGTEIGGTACAVEGLGARRTGSSFVMNLDRLATIRYPDGGYSYFTYYNDDYTKWGGQGGFEDSLSVSYDTDPCQDGPYPEYPCIKSGYFDFIGRDPFFINMLEAVRRVAFDTISQAVDSNIVSYDSLSYDWYDYSEPNMGYISMEDTFYTDRFIMEGEDSETKIYKYAYQQIPERGNYSVLSRDRGWAIKLIRTESWITDDFLQQFRTITNYHYYRGDYHQNGYYLGTLQDSCIVTKKDGITTERYFIPQWVDENDYHESNILSNTVIDEWGGYSTTIFEDSHFDIINDDSYYTNTLVETSRYFSPDSILRNRQDYRYYSGVSGPGHIGQLKDQVTYLINDQGWVTDSIIESSEYIRYTSVQNRDQGALRKSITPLGDSVIFHYVERVPAPPGYDLKPDVYYYNSPVYYNYLFQGNTIDDNSMDGSASPDWYKRDIYLSNDTIRFDSIVKIESSPHEIRDDIKIFAAYGAPVLMDSARLLCDQTVSYLLTLPRDSVFHWSYGRAAIYKNDDLMDQIQGGDVKAGVNSVSGQIQADSGDVIKIYANAGIDNRGNAAASFNHLAYIPKSDPDTTFLTTPNAVSDYRLFNDEKLEILYDGNSFISYVNYDPLDRVNAITLPGGFVDDPSVSFPPYDTCIKIFPDFDAEYVENINTVTNCLKDTIRAAAIQSSGNPYWVITLLNFKYYNITSLGNFNVDSVLLKLYCSEAGHKNNFVFCGRYGNHEVYCGDGFPIPYITWQFGDLMDTGFNRLNVTDMIDGWTSDTLQVKTICLGIDYEYMDMYDSVKLLSTEYFDMDFWPALEVHGQFVYDPDTVFSIRYDYDDFPDDGDRVGVSIKTRDDTAGAASYINESRVWFDGFGRAVQRESIDSTGNYDSTLTNYDYLDRTKTTTDQSGYSTSFKYDHHDRLIKTTFPDNYSKNVKHFGASMIDLDPYNYLLPSMRDSSLYVTEYTDENGNKAFDYNDVMGRLRLKRAIPDTGDTLNTYFNYDDMGNLITVIKPKGDLVNYRYNNLGWLLKEWSADYDTITYLYDKKGRVTFVRDGNLSENAHYDTATGYLTYAEWRYYDYDALDRVIASGFSCGVSPGNMIKYVRTRYFYDKRNSSYSQGRLSLYYDKEDDSCHYGEKYDYDQRGRIIKQTNYYKAALDSILIDPSIGFYEFTLTGEDEFIYRYEYNFADKITKIVYPDSFIVTYSYDNLGRLEKIGNEANSAAYATYKYTERNAVEQVILGDSCQSVDYIYNSRGWLEAINSPDSDTLLAPDHFRQSIGYYTDMSGSEGFKNGNIAGISYKFDSTVNFIKYNYGYDGLDRLLNVDKSPLGTGQFYPQELFEYDENGNIEEYIYHLGLFTADTIDYQINANSNQLDAISGSGSNSFTYDANGNINTDLAQNTTYSYNLRNQLSRMDISFEIGTEYVEFTYDKDGQRIRKKYRDLYSYPCDTLYPPDPPIERMMFLMGEQQQQDCIGSNIFITKYVRSGGKTLMKCAGDTVRYIFAGDDRIALVDSDGDVYYYIKDHLGNTRILVKESPADVDTVYAKYTEYLAYGFASLGSQSLNQAYRFTGKELDQEGGVNQYYFGSRYYNTEGRWLAVDPQHSKYYGWSPYNYSLCNPISNYDPNGEWVVRALKTAYKVGKRVYNAAKSGKSLRKFDTWKKAGIDEFYDIVDNAKTLIDGDLNADDAFAAIDLVTGFGGEAKKLSKSLGLLGDKALSKVDDVADAASRIETHHLLPIQFEKHFKKAGFDINQITAKMTAANHRLREGPGIHTNAGGNWNKRWKEFFEKYEDSETGPSPQEILDQLDKMKKDFGID